MKDGIVAIFDYKVSPEETHLRLFQKEEEIHTVVLQGEIMFFGTINKLEIIILDPAQGQWAIFNVRSPKEAMKTGTFPFRSPSPYRARLLLFPESKIMGIFEIGNHENTEARFSFMPYPPPPAYNEKDCWTHIEPNLFNHQVTPLNLKDRVAYYAGKVDDKIKFHVLDVIAEKYRCFEVDKPESEAQYCLKHVAELTPDLYLLSIEAMKLEFRYMVFDASKPTEPLRPFKTKLTDDVDSIISIGTLLYVLEFKVDKQGQPIENDLTVIDKRTELPIHKDKCLVVAGVDYFPSTTMDQELIRVESEYNCSNSVNVQTLGPATSAQDYIHLLQQITGGKMRNDMIQYVIDAIADV